MYKEEREETQRWKAELYEAEQEEIRRTNTPLSFRGELTNVDFRQIAYKCAKRIKRISDVDVIGSKVYCTVTSQSGISNWEFYLDFNNYGRVTGDYWVKSDNKDSNIPSALGNMIKNTIAAFIRN